MKFAVLFSLLSSTSILHAQEVPIIPVTFPEGFRGMVVYDGILKGTAVIAPQGGAGININGGNVQLDLGGLFNRALNKRTVPLHGTWHVEAEYEGNTVRGRSVVQSEIEGLSENVSFVGTRNGDFCDLSFEGQAPLRITCTPIRFESNVDYTNESRQKIKASYIASRTSAVDYVERDRLNAERKARTASATGSIGTVAGTIDSETPPPGKYLASQFKEIDTWESFFEKAQTDRPDFKRFINELIEISVNGDASAWALVTGAKRNLYQKTLTDFQLYGLYFSGTADMLAKIRQCRAPRYYSAAEACDCVAGFPGATTIGVGAGELIVSSNGEIGNMACKVAADNETNPKIRARYAAQRARALIYDSNTTKNTVIEMSNLSVRTGFPRANIVKASAVLNAIELRGGDYKVEPSSSIEDTIGIGFDFVKQAEAAKIPEASIVGRQFLQVIAWARLNSSVFSSFVAATSVPNNPRSYAGCKEEGVPCIDEKYDRNGNIAPR